MPLGELNYRILCYPHTGGSVFGQLVSRVIASSEKGLEEDTNIRKKEDCGSGGWK